MRLESKEKERQEDTESSKQNHDDVYNNDMKSTNYGTKHVSFIS